MEPSRGIRLVEWFTVLMDSEPTQMQKLQNVYAFVVLKNEKLDHKCRLLGKSVSVRFKK
jgi:hypothetical protein